MVTAYVFITVITILANAAIAGADFARARFVLANSAAVGVPQSWLPWLGALKAAGAAGLLLGLLGVPGIGIAAATGLVLFFVGAVAAHVRPRVYATIVFPGGFLALAVAALVLGVAR
ncbi:DoxX family protein [Streptomyces sp. DG2A-72]|uniref:DoxX family protein n=1 Tax=Streptomyces sp. DG2A-72 TaxID=3051386 RepID=UPI00265BCB54|nr:DoxX family protein [Streptomyces sp. DG2A-72]MDO0938856.1 DoxX family protein [Streptomyces sp. DG2A-72]